MIDYRQQFQFEKLVKDKVAEAAEKFNLPQLYNVEIRFNLKGRVAGRASYLYHKTNPQIFILEFNPEAIAKNWDDMVNNTIPHEVAHSVCQANPKLGRGHNRGWKAVCRVLGGNPVRCHTYDLTPAKKTRNFLYRADNGREEIFKTTRHNKMQKGIVSAYLTNDNVRFTKEHFVKEIKK